MMPTTPTLTLCDELARLIRVAWDPPAGSAVERVYEAPVRADAMTGRRVFLFPVDYGGDPASRGEDWVMHRVAVLVAERYDGSGQPPAEWVDERADFVWDRVYQGLDYTRAPLRFDGRTVHTETAGPVEVYDAGLLTTKKLFWSEVEFVFREAV